MPRSDLDIAAFDRAVTDHAAAVFLRYFSFNRVENIEFDQPSLALERDRELLRLHWSLSSPVTKLATYVLEHRHEVQSVLSSEVRTEDGILRGRLDARATVMLRRRSGLDTALVSHEPIRSYSSGPNHVLGWVLKEAWSLASRFASITLDSPAYQSAINHARQRLDQCSRLQSIAQITNQTVLNRRPTSGALVEASRSRRALYRMATDAYRHLVAIEAGDPKLVTAMLRETLLGPLESWRRFELAIGLSLGEALAASQAKQMMLNLLIGDTRRSLARSGRFSVFWQWQTPYYKAPELEPSEIVERDILNAYGIPFGGAIPDLVVVDHHKDAVVAIVEVKYLIGEDATDRVKAAITQLVRYARGYAPITNLGPLLERSLAVVSQGIEGLTLQTAPEGIPGVMDFAGIKEAVLAQWADRLCADGLPSA